MLRVLLTMLFVSACAFSGFAQNLELYPEVPKEIKSMVTGGRYAEAKQALLELARQTNGEKARRLRNQAEILDRIRLDFSLTEEALLERLRKDIPDVTREDLARWHQQGHLWCRYIDGENWYFNSSVSDLYRLSESARERADWKMPVQDSELYMNHIAEVVRAASGADTPYLLPQRLRIEYVLTVDADVVPEGETLRCWMLYPRECDTQRDIQLIASNPSVKKIAPPDQPQRTLYFEAAAVEGQPTLFSATYEYTAYAYHQTIDPAKVKPYDTDGDLYRQYTAEREPHLLLTPEIRAAASEAVGEENNPYLKARKIFDWIQRNITYAYMLEYSTVPNLSQWCLKYGHGDCGVQSLLYIAMCRAEGMPARWQSGWSAEPDNDGMHDWSEIYIKPFGWLRVDPSRGYLNSDDEAVRWFHFGSFDRYRLIASGDYGRQLNPPKQHFRSEPVDFQRGEVECSGGNLYFDKWGYSMKVTAVK